MNRFWKLSASCFLVLIASTISFSCNDPSEVGQEFFNGEEKNVIQEFYDDIPHKIAYKDSLLTGSRSVQQYLFGSVEDPVFGKFQSDLLVSFSNISAGDSRFNDEDTQVDSAVLVLQLDPTNRMGDTLNNLSLSLYELEENLVRSARLDSEWKISESPMFQAQFEPNYYDTLLVNILGDTLSKQDPGNRFLLPQSFAEFLADTNLYIVPENGDSTELTKKFKGFYFDVSGSEHVTSANINSSFGTKIELHYTKKDDEGNDIKGFFVLGANNRANRIKFDRTGSELENIFLGEENKDQLPLESMSGAMIEVEFPSLDHLRGKIINKAELLVRVDTSFHDPLVIDGLNRVVTLFREDGDLKYSFDAILGLNQNATLEESKNQFNVNVTNQLIEYINGGEKKMYLAPQIVAYVGQTFEEDYRYQRTMIRPIDTRLFITYSE